MYERFTDRARKVMQLANQEAQRFNHEYIGTEHVLLGLSKEGAGVAANVLKNFDVDLRTIRLEVEKLIQSGPDWGASGKLPLTPRVKKVIELAIEESCNLHHDHVGTEHLLLGLLREEDGVASQILMNLGLTLNRVREEVRSVLGGSPDAGGVRPAVEPARACESDLGTKDDVPPTLEGRKRVYERFTDRARKVMQLANQEAQRLNHEYIGTEHVLLGLLKEGTGVAAHVLKNLDVDLAKIRLEVEKLVVSGPDSVKGKLPQTPRAKKVIEYSMEESRNLNHNYVGTEHILLGLLREEEGVAARVLMNLGLKLEEVREEILNLLGYGIGASEPQRDLKPSVEASGARMSPFAHRLLLILIGVAIAAFFYWLGRRWP